MAMTFFKGPLSDFVFHIMGRLDAEILFGAEMDGNR
jgi:hypothetical protein